MISKKLTFLTMAALFSSLAQAEAVEPPTVATPDAEFTILYTAIAWGNAVDYGSSFVPIRAYESLAACDAEKMKMVEAWPGELRKLARLQCSAAKTGDEKVLAKMLVSKRQNQ